MRLVFGGTFDPVHSGHLQMAEELCAHLSVSNIYLMPCYRAVHKDSVAASPEQRLQMLSLAVAASRCIRIDDREIKRAKPSYTIDSLYEIRSEIDPAEPLCLVMGDDTARHLSTWRRIKEFSNLCHLVILQRPACQANSFVLNEEGEPCLSRLGWERAETPKSLHDSAFGRYHCVSLSQVTISSTYVRECVVKNKSLDNLVPGAVSAFICDNGLYSQVQC